MWNTWVLWVFILPDASNFIMETEDNSIQRQLYDSFIILVGAALLNKMTFIDTKSSIIDYLGVWNPPLVCLFSVKNVTKKIKT